MASANRWQDIFLHLQQKGFNVFSPGTKKGVCTEQYVVVKVAGASKHGDFSTIDQYFQLYCYVPSNKYSELESYVDSVKSAMKELKPKFWPEGTDTPSFYEEEIDAHMISTTYRCYKRQ